jgi:hypothetical protein
MQVAVYRVKKPAAMSSAKSKFKYRVLPLPLVQREAKKMLTARQLREGVALARRLRDYPDAPDLSIEPCGDGMELRIESPAINPQGWLRAIFWIHKKSRTIYIIDLFWKKSNRVMPADLHRANHRIRLLKAELG